MKIDFSPNRKESGQSLQSFKGVPPNPKYYSETLAKLGKLAGEYVSTPEQKMFMATTALMLQPLVDLKFADDDQKVDTAIKSASKAIAGGLTGVTIRAFFIKLTTKYIKFNKRNKLKKYFMPKGAIEDYLDDAQKAQIKLKQYNQSLGTLFAILFMVLFSNSKIDVPLTSDFQDIISGVVKEEKSWIESISSVAVKRKNKIEKKLKHWLNIKDTVVDKYKRIKNIATEGLPQEGSK